MDAVKFLKEKYRMTKECSIRCTDCPFYTEKNTTGLRCGDLQGVYPEIAVAIVEKWSEEHPQETRLSQFLKYYPNARLDSDGTPVCLCPSDLGLMDVDGCTCECDICWNRPIEEE
nr:MAG TPA: hypothetical protein [Caudoviricetes sp.]